MEGEPKEPETPWPIEVARLDMCFGNWNSKDARQGMLGIKAADITDSKKQKRGMLRTRKVLFQYED